MKSIQIDKFGGPEVLAIKDVEIKGVDLKVEIFVFQDKLVDMIHRKVKINPIGVDPDLLELCSVVRVVCVR